MLSPYIVPFFIGAFALAVIGSLLAYPLMRWTITRYRGVTPCKTSETSV